MKTTNPILKEILLPWQMRWVNDTSRFKIVLWSRQTGKSFSIAREQALDGIYVIRTSEPADRLSADDAVRTYKSLGTICRTTIAVGGIPVTMDTEPTPHQSRIFTLLEAKSPVWNRHCAQ